MTMMVLNMNKTAPPKQSQKIVDEQFDYLMTLNPGRLSHHIRLLKPMSHDDYQRPAEDDNFIVFSSRRGLEVDCKFKQIIPIIQTRYYALFTDPITGLKIAVVNLPGAEIAKIPVQENRPVDAIQIVNLRLVVIQAVIKDEADIIIGDFGTFLGRNNEEHFKFMKSTADNEFPDQGPNRRNFERLLVGFFKVVVKMTEALYLPVKHVFRNVGTDEFTNLRYQTITAMAWVKEDTMKRFSIGLDVENTREVFNSYGHFPIVLTAQRKRQATELTPPVSPLRAPPPSPVPSSVPSSPPPVAPPPSPQPVPQPQHSSRLDPEPSPALQQPSIVAPLPSTMQPPKAAPKQPKGIRKGYEASSFTVSTAPTLATFVGGSTGGHGDTRPATFAKLLTNEPYVPQGGPQREPLVSIRKPPPILADHDQSVPQPKEMESRPHFHLKTQSPPSRAPKVIKIMSYNITDSFDPLPGRYESIKRDFYDYVHILGLGNTFESTKLLPPGVYRLPIYSKKHGPGLPIQCIASKQQLSYNIETPVDPASEMPKDCLEGALVENSLSEGLTFDQMGEILGLKQGLFHKSSFLMYAEEFTHLRIASVFHGIGQDIWDALKEKYDYTNALNVLISFKQMYMHKVLSTDPDVIIGDFCSFLASSPDQGQQFMTEFAQFVQGSRPDYIISPKELAEACFAYNDSIFKLLNEKGYIAIRPKFGRESNMFTYCSPWGFTTTDMVWVHHRNMNRFEMEAMVLNDDSVFPVVGQPGNRHYPITLTITPKPGPLLLTDSPQAVYTKLDLIEIDIGKAYTERYLIHDKGALNSLALYFDGAGQFNEHWPIDPVTAKILRDEINDLLPDIMGNDQMVKTTKELVNLHFKPTVEDIDLRALKLTALEISRVFAVYISKCVQKYILSKPTTKVRGSLLETKKTTGGMPRPNLRIANMNATYVHTSSVAKKPETTDTYTDILLKYYSGKDEAGYFVDTHMYKVNEDLYILPPGLMFTTGEQDERDNGIMCRIERPKFIGKYETQDISASSQFEIVMRAVLKREKGR